MDTTSTSTVALGIAARCQALHMQPDTVYAHTKDHVVQATMTYRSPAAWEYNGQPFPSPSAAARAAARDLGLHESQDGWVFWRIMPRPAAARTSTKTADMQAELERRAKRILVLEAVLRANGIEPPPADARLLPAPPTDTADSTLAEALDQIAAEAEPQDVRIEPLPEPAPEPRADVAPASLLLA